VPRVHDPRDHGPVEERLAVCGVLEGEERVPARERGLEIHRAGLLAEVEAHGRGAEVPERDRGDHVLRRVLATVVEPARRVHPALHHLALRGRRALDDVHDAPAIVAHVDHARLAEKAEIAGLPPGFRVECGPVEHDRMSAAFLEHREHARLVLQLPGRDPAETLGHPRFHAFELGFSRNGCQRAAAGLSGRAVWR
jgi:hypothetical protein